ncbi:TlpA disulfide reductase family protein [Polaribacter staleyi]|uniref:TlpA family protein disulfide reductase n=1 Tax=Polaribacter staleyi TaxID=2022337 RepID=UPI0031BB8F90
MKKRIVTIALVFFVLWSCKKEVAVNYVILSGNINNTKGGELKVSSLNGFKKDINVNNTGVFLDTLFIEEDGLYNLRYEQVRSTPYLSKGATVQFNVDAKQPTNTLKFAGGHAELNNYFAYKANKDFEFMKDRSGSFNVEESAFESKTLELQKDLENKLSTIKDVPESFRSKEMIAINYGRLLKKANYERMYGYLNKDRAFKASDNFKKELLELSFDNGEDYLHSKDYQQIVGNNINQKAYGYYQKDSLPYPEAMAKSLSEINNVTIRNMELYKNISMNLSMSQDKDKDLKDFLNASTNENHKSIVKALFEDLKVLDAGQPSPKFQNFENYAGGTTSLDDLKGKYVYIDVWATWCGPCKYEIPFLKKVEEQYHDKNIHFVSLSVDKQKDKDKWKKMIVDKELQGTQIISDNDFNTSFVNNYKINGIPQFILIDPQGNIVKANAPRPSEEKLIELFKELKI